MFIYDDCFCISSLIFFLSVCSLIGLLRTPINLCLAAQHENCVFRPSHQRHLDAIDRSYGTSTAPVAIDFSELCCRKERDGRILQPEAERMRRGTKDNNMGSLALMAE